MKLQPIVLELQLDLERMERQRRLQMATYRIGMRRFVRRALSAGAVPATDRSMLIGQPVLQDVKGWKDPWLMIHPEDWEVAHGQFWVDYYRLRDRLDDMQHRLYELGQRQEVVEALRSTIGWPTMPATTMTAGEMSR